MKNITKSASKLVLLYVVLILGLITSFSVVWDITHGSFNELTKIILGVFSSSVTFLFGFYFGYKGDTPGNTIQTTTATTETKSVGADLPFVGK